MSKKVVVIGGGAAGLMSAISAAENGNDVIIVEKNQKVGRKIMITGKGRCNVTNNSDVNNVLKNIPGNPKFLYSALNKFSPYDTISFFEECGVRLKTERGNRVFPVSDKASDIVDALFFSVRKHKIGIINGEAEHILTDGVAVTGVKLKKGEKIRADAVILATGGLSYPQTGSTGDGYKMAKEAGHTVEELNPSLVPLCIKENACNKLMGLSLKNVNLSVYENDGKKPIFSELGEMLFTHFGISGPLVLSASSHMHNIGENRYKCVVDLKPGLSEEQLDKRILRDFSENANRDFINSLNKLLPSKMIPVTVALSKIPKDKKVNQISYEERKRLVNVIKNFNLTVTGTRPVEEAIITRGGIRVGEINSATMESKIIKGLYFAGEIIDVDAYTGGYNLQIAFSTGFLAGSSIK